MPHKDKKIAQEYFAKRHRKNYDPAKAREQYLKNREQILKNSRKTHLKRTYGLSIAQYQEMVENQHNRCFVCNQYETRLLKTGLIKPLSVDHNHTTGTIRKLLCNDCNAALGFVKEDPELLQKLIAYLHMHEE